MQGLTSPSSAQGVSTHLYLQQALGCTPFLTGPPTELPASMLAQRRDLQLWSPAARLGASEPRSLGRGTQDPSSVPQSLICKMELLTVAAWWALVQELRWNRARNTEMPSVTPTGGSQGRERALPGPRCFVTTEETTLRFPY